MKEQPNNSILFNFFLLGCEWATLCRNSMLYYDFHKGNILANKNGDLSVVDIDDVEIAKFPEEMQKYANGLINLYANFGMELGAAFRYGFINAAGKTGNVLYDIMYNNNKLTSLKSVAKIRKVDINTEHLNKIYTEWNTLIDNSFVKNITDNSYKYGEFSYIELMERNLDDYHKFKEIYINNTNLMKHEYQVYFANGIYSENNFDIAATALTLCQLEFSNQQYFLAAYYLILAREIILNNEVFSVSLKKDIRFGEHLFVSKFGQEKSQKLLDYIFHETMRLRIERGIENYFYEIWYWEDFTRENSIEDFSLERWYGCYVCLDCNNVGFFDEELSICGLCGAKKLNQISLQKYIEIKINLLKTKSNDIPGQVITDDTSLLEEIPNIDRASLLPAYIQMVCLYEQKKNYDVAIEIARRIEFFLKDNPNICDKKGYVIEKAREGGQLFYSPIEPNNLTKLFLEETENVKNDYESYICHKLCNLYKENGNDTMALEYAHKTICLANNSPRWLQQTYVIYAYSLIKTYYDNCKKHNESLMYSNILFTYSMLDKMDKELSKDTKSIDIDDTIEALVTIGKSNSEVGNLHPAYSCYILALKMHIYHYGCRHPETAMIYSSIAQLLAIKKVYDEAYDFWAISLILLEGCGIERYKSQVLKIETDISRCLSDSDYQGDLSAWKEEWLKEKVFNVFPERRFEKMENEENGLPKIEISKEDILKQYTVYNP